jgi:hypothetical protein
MGTGVSVGLAEGVAIVGTALPVEALEEVGAAGAAVHPARSSVAASTAKHLRI